MAELGEITKIKINVDINISEETATRCCQILEMYLADNPDKTIKCQQDGYPIVWIGYRDTAEREG